MGFLMGKPSKQTSSNKSYDFLQGALGGTVGQVGDSMSAIKALLGGDSSGFDAKYPAPRQCAPLG